MSLAARRAVFRWSWRLFRREWRQQLLVLALLTTTVTASIFGAVAVQQLVHSADAEFGSADHILQLPSTNAAGLARDLDRLRARFGTIEVIGSRAVTLPGSVGTIEYRSQDPHGAFSAPRLALRSGRYPTGRAEIAVTDGVATRAQVAAGGTLALDGVPRRVVGIVENPADLADEFALVPPGDPAARRHAVLVRATEDQMRDLRVQTDVMMRRGQDENVAAAVGALAIAVVVAILVCLVAAAGFVALAQRRLRQLGMLAAIGATERHLRLVVLANGLLVGAVSAVVGALLATAAWVVASPVLEGPAGHRVDRFSMPLWIVASGMAIALLTAAAAAWWPGRSVARIPVTAALSARPPRPRQVHRSALAALALVGVGCAGLTLGLDPKAGDAKVLLFLPGVAALVVGMLLVSPLAIRLLGPLGRRAPVAGRLALRDLARNQARSGIALAAIALSLGIAVTTVVLATASEHTAGEGNLSAHDVLVRFPVEGPVLPVLSATALTRQRAAVERMAVSLHGTVVPLQAAVTTGGPQSSGGVQNRSVVLLGRPIDAHTVRDAGTLYVATPALLRRLGLRLDQVDPRAEVLTPLDGPITYANILERNPATPVTARIDVPTYSSAPRSLLTPTALRRYGWTTTTAGWFVTTSRPLTRAQVAAAESTAARAGLVVETRDQQQGLGTLRVWATAVGMGLALAILAMTVGIIRAESTGDLRTLAATGASAGTRRTIVAVTAAALAGLGVLLGTAGAYLALVASYLGDLGRLGHVPAVELVVTAVGVPLVAAAAGWLLGGREPTSVSRAALE